MRHLIGIVGASAALLAAWRFRQDVADPARYYIRRLESVDTSTRSEAVRELSRFPGTRTIVQALLQALGDEDTRVRGEAAAAIAIVYRRPATDPQGREVKLALDPLLRDRNVRVRHSAAIALSRLGLADEAALPALLAASRVPDLETRWSAINVLGPFGKDHANVRERLFEALDDSDPTVRMMAVRAMAWQVRGVRPDPLMGRGILRALADADANVRTAATSAVGMFGEPTPIERSRLLGMLADPDPLVRGTAAVALPIGPWQRGFIPGLCRALEDRKPEVRRSAAIRLAAMGADGEAALAPLGGASRDRNDLVRDAAADAVRAIQWKAKEFRDRLLPEALHNLADESSALRAIAATYLGDCGARASPAVPALMTALADADSKVRLAAAAALGRIVPGAEAAVPALEALANQDDPILRRVAADSLRSIRDADQ